MSDSLWPNELQHTRIPCPSPSPRVCSNSGPLSQWCHPTISSSVVPFSSCLQSFQASGSFPKSWLFASGGHSIGASALAPVLPRNIQCCFPLGLTGLISLLSKARDSIKFSPTHNSEASVFRRSALFMVQLSHLYMTTGKTVALTIWTFVGKVMPLLFNMLFGFVIAFLPWSKLVLAIIRVMRCDPDCKSLEREVNFPGQHGGLQQNESYTQNLTAARLQGWNNLTLDKYPSPFTVYRQIPFKKKSNDWQRPFPLHFLAHKWDV